MLLLVYIWRIIIIANILKKSMIVCMIMHTSPIRIKFARKQAATIGPIYTGNVHVVGRGLIPCIYQYIESTYNEACMHEKSKIPFSYMLCLFCKRAYRGTKPEESFG